MRLLLVVLASLGAAGFFSLATALKHRSAGTLPAIERFSPSAVGSFALATLRHPLWLAGIGADVGGLGLQITALHLGALSLVQPLLVSAVLFSLVVAHRIAGTRMARREVGYAALLVLAVSGFLVVSGALGVREGKPFVGSTIAATAVVVVLVVTCILMARRLRTSGGGRWSAALLGLAAGIIYACTAALIKSCAHVVATRGVLALPTAWQLYVLVAAGAMGLFFAQMAFQAGPLAASLPATASVDPLASVLLALAVFHEKLNSDPLAVTMSLLTLVVMLFTVTRLSLVRAHLEAGATAPGDPARDPASAAEAS
ncbi:MAG: DMT family transporter [Actinomycetota bacterium]|nr:DMT family transporter [Actinomycetota bacterium]